jgi:hypothetical protein
LPLGPPLQPTLWLAKQSTDLPKHKSHEATLTPKYQQLYTTHNAKPKFPHCSCLLFHCPQLKSSPKERSFPLVSSLLPATSCFRKPAIYCLCLKNSHSSSKTPRQRLRGKGWNCPWVPHTESVSLFLSHPTVITQVPCEPSSSTLFYFLPWTK